VVLITVDGFPASLWDDPSLCMPNLKTLAAQGAMAKSMLSANPSITWPNHTSLVTGCTAARHGVLFNGMLLRQGPGVPPKFEQWRDKNELVRVPTIYDVANKAGLTTAHVDWIPVQKAGTFSWEFEERPDVIGAIPQEMIKAGVMTAAELETFSKRSGAWRDEAWTRAGEHIIKAHKPNLLLFHLLNTDTHNHKYAPGSQPSHTAYAFADTCIKRIMDSLSAAGLKEKATVIITTDHGFKTARRIIRPNIVLRDNGLLKSAGLTITSCDVYAQSSGGSTMLYITDPSKKAELIPKLKEYFNGLEGIEKVFEPADYPTLGLPSPDDNVQMGDLFVPARAGYGMSGALAEGDAVVDVNLDDPTTYPGHHGYLNSDPQMNGVFIAWGYGIKPGVIEPIKNLDVAPTIAKLLGVELPTAEGRVLKEILK